MRLPNWPLQATGASVAALPLAPAAERQDRWADEIMKTQLLPGETVIKDGAANLQQGIETVGGRVHLTSQRLVFESHAINIQTGTTIIPLESITGVQKCWTRFLNLIPLFPNSVAIATKEGKEYRFVMYDRQSWMDAIDGQKG